jgi:hypothetical protein
MSLSTEVLTNQSQPLQAPAEDDLAALVYHVSTLAHSDVPVNELVERTGSLVLYSLHADSIRILLQDAQSGSPATFSDSRARSAGGSESFLYLRPIAIRGVSYGHVEISVSDAKWPVSALLSVAETVAELLGRRAEREELRSELSALREQAEDLRNRHNLDVLLTRAIGIVANARSWPAGKAEEWIRQEALRQGYPLLRFAERLILAQTLNRRLAPPRPGMPLRRTA